MEVGINGINKEAELQTIFHAVMDFMEKVLADAAAASLACCSLIAANRQRLPKSVENFNKVQNHEAKESKQRVCTD